MEISVLTERKLAKGRFHHYVYIMHNHRPVICVGIKLKTLSNSESILMNKIQSHRLNFRFFFTQVNKSTLVARLYHCTIVIKSKKRR